MEPLNGREAIRQMFEIEFGRASMTCIVENVFEDGEWAILEWRDPTGLRGCGFFHVRNDQIIFQRGYFDQLSFFRQQGIAVPKTYLGASQCVQAEADSFPQARGRQNIGSASRRERV